MSSLSQFAPFAGGGLKSFQTGYVYTGASTNGVSFSEDIRFTDVTVSSVSTSKAISGIQGVCITGQLAAYYSANAVAQYQSSALTSRLTSATNLRLASNASYNVTYGSHQMMGRWQVAEAN